MQGDAWSLNMVGRMLPRRAGTLVLRWETRLAPSACFFLPTFLDRYPAVVAVSVSRRCFGDARCAVARTTRIGRGGLAGAVIYAGVLLPALGFVNIYYMRYADVSDHFQYHACMAAIAGATACAVSIVERWTKGGRIVASASSFGDCRRAGRGDLASRPSVYGQ